MNILLFLIPVSVVLLGIAVWAFRWAVRQGQFENLDAAAIDILRDDSSDGPAAADVAPEASTEASTPAATGHGRGGPAPCAPGAADPEPADHAD